MPFTHFAVYPLTVAGGAGQACAEEYCSELYNMRNSVVIFFSRSLDLETHPPCEATVLLLPHPGLSL